MTKFLVVCLLTGILLSPLSALGQNLVPNPHFSNYSSPPDQYHQIARATGWASANIGTPDFYHKDCPYSCPGYIPYPYNNVHIPVNVAGEQDDALGVNGNNGASGYAGILIGDSRPFNVRNDIYREYIKTQLTQPLEAGQQYELSFYVSLAETSDFTVPNISMAFSTTNIFQNDALRITGLTPVLNSGRITNKTAWVKVEGTYTPTVSGLQYLVIGYFDQNLGDQDIAVINGSCYFGYAPNELGTKTYYYIDAVSIKKCSCTDNFELSVVPSIVGDGQCCYDVYVKNTSKCSNLSSSSIQFSLNGTGYVFTPTGGGNFLFPSNVEIKVGSFCVSSGSIPPPGSPAVVNFMNGSEVQCTYSPLVPECPTNCCDFYKWKLFNEGSRLLPDPNDPNRQIEFCCFKVHGYKDNDYIVNTGTPQNPIITNEFGCTRKNGITFSVDGALSASAWNIPTVLGEPLMGWFSNNIYCIPAGQTIRFDIKQGYYPNEANFPNSPIGAICKTTLTGSCDDCCNQIKITSESLSDITGGVCIPACPAGQCCAKLSITWDPETAYPDPSKCSGKISRILIRGNGGNGGNRNDAYDSPIIQTITPTFPQTSITLPQLNINLNECISGGRQYDIEFYDMSGRLFCRKWHHVSCGGFNPNIEKSNGDDTGYESQSSTQDLTLSIKPNPATDKAVIEYSVPTSDAVSINAYDLLGNKVAQIYTGYSKAGFHSFEWDLSKIPSGVYLLRVSQANAMRVLRLTIGK